MMDKPSPTAMHTGPILLKYRNDCSIFRSDSGKDEFGKLILECNHCHEAHVVEWGFEYASCGLEADKRRLEDLWIEHCVEWHNA